MHHHQYLTYCKLQLQMLFQSAGMSVILVLQLIHNCFYAVYVNNKDSLHVGKNILCCAISLQQHGFLVFFLCVCNVVLNDVVFSAWTQSSQSHWAKESD